MSPRWGGFVVTYRRPEALRRSLDRLLGQTRPPEHLWVMDNDPDRSARDVVRDLSGRVAYRSLPDNPGPAGAAAAALEALLDLDRDVSWFYWGDDDDPPEAQDTIERLLGLASPNRKAPVGAVAAAGVRWDWWSGRPVRLADDELDGAVELDAVGGGMQLLVHRDAVEAVGLPNARLFFGLEDYEYCLRIRRAGYAILADGARIRARRARRDRLDHTPQRRATPRGGLHTVPRDYYATRNYVYSMGHTFRRPDLVGRKIARTLARMLLSWLRGPAYGRRFTRSQARALIDGLRGRLGRTVSLEGSKP